MHPGACETGEGYPGHLSFGGWGAVVPTQEVEEAMDREESRLHLRLVPDRFCLTRDSGPRQCQVAQVGARGITARKSEDVGHLVIVEELAVQPPQFAISRDTHRELG